MARERYQVASGKTIVPHGAVPVTARTLLVLAHLALGQDDFEWEMTVLRTRGLVRDDKTTGAPAPTKAGLALLKERKLLVKRPKRK